MSVSATSKGAEEYEAEVVPGIESVAIEELQARFAGGIREIRRIRPGFVRFAFAGGAAKLAALRSVIAVYQIHRFAVPRPKALLGHEHFTRLIGLLLRVAGSFEAPPQTFGIGAAGSGTSVMRRLRSEIAEAIGLEPALDEKGQLYFRLTRQGDSGGWEVLIRTKAEPLSKRGYRIVDKPGALNATVAYAMTTMGRLPARATVVNLCSGTSTILIELAFARRGDRLFAVDNNASMLAAGIHNAKGGSGASRIQHIRADATCVPLPAQSVQQLYADLPFGNLIGSHDDNVRLYPAILREAARLAIPEATFIVLTHEVSLLQRSLVGSVWTLASETRLNLSGLHPRLFVLRRNSTRIESNSASKA